MARKFCKTLYRLIQKKGRAPCIEEVEGRRCEGYIRKVDEGEEPVYTENMDFADSFEIYRCDKVKEHKWKVTLSNFVETPLFQRLD